jgi:cobalamin biosynthesis protein CobT
MPRFAKGSDEAKEYMNSIRDRRKKKEATVEAPKDDEKKEPEEDTKEPVSKKNLPKKAKKTVKIPAVKFFSGSFPQHEEAGNPVIRKTFGIEETMRRIRAFKKH